MVAKAKKSRLDSFSFLNEPEEVDKTDSVDTENSEVHSQEEFSGVSKNSESQEKGITRKRKPKGKVSVKPSNASSSSHMVRVESEVYVRIKKKILDNLIETGRSFSNSDMIKYLLDFHDEHKN